MIRPVLLRSLLAVLLVLAAGGALASALAQPAAPQPAAAQPKDEITLERIMADPDWIGNPPEDPYWSDDGSAVYFFKKHLGSEHRDLYRVPIAGGAPALVADADLGRVDRPGRYSHDWTKKVWAREGDIYVKDLRSGSVRQLTRSEAVERDPLFLVGDREVAYRRDKTFFAYDLETGLERQVADLRLAKDPDAAEETTFLTAEGPRLYRFLGEKKEREKAERERARAEQQADPTRPPVPFYLGEDLEITDTELSPAGRWLIVALRKKNADEGKKDKMAVFLTDSGMVETKDVRPIVGTPKPETPKLVLLDLERHEQHGLDLSVLPGITEDPLKTLREAAEKARAAAKPPAPDEKKADKEKEKSKGREKEKDKDKTKAEPTPRAVRVRDLQWSDDGLHLALQAFSADHKDRWLVEVEPAAAKVVPLERLHDDAWINWYFNDLGWMRDGKAVWYLSEESGYSQLYVRPLDGKKRAVTQGSWEVSEVNLSRDGATFFLVTNKEHPGVREAYRVPAAGGALERLSTLGGMATLVVSPDDTKLLLLDSFPTRPPELFVQKAQAGAEAWRITDSTSPEFKAIHWTAPEIVPIPSRHVAQPIYSRVYTPAGWTADKRYPAVVFIHGAGYLQNAHQGWSDYFREFMFHSLLTREGYVVLDMDYRASAGYGRAWRTAIYRQMGWPELEDLEDGKAWIVAHKAVDSQRVGVYGGSYGGFLTFMALFRKPELFAAGAALRPVTDWAHYNDPYTSDILNTPDVDPEAYRKSSPIEYAAGLSKPLLICHGVVDSNVTFQDTVHMVERLIELGKTRDFTTAIYPVESHGFEQWWSWLDEYTRIHDFFADKLGVHPEH